MIIANVISDNIDRFENSKCKKGLNSIEQIALDEGNTSYPPAGIIEMTMISLYLKEAAQTQILLTNPVGV